MKKARTFSLNHRVTELIEPKAPHQRPSMWTPNLRKVACYSAPSREVTLGDADDHRGIFTLCLNIQANG